MENKNYVKGYKVFNPDWTCRGFQYEVGKTYEENITPETCSRGFHFCERASDCFNYYSFSSRNKVAEIVALGDIDTDGVKSCTNKIQIIREIPWDELLKIVNKGRNCTGLRNTGSRNTGHYNTGNLNTGNCNTRDWNTGNYNTGNYNTGNHNTGNHNTGNWNTGDCNIGNYNTGDCNTGNYNTGNWNTGDWNTGDWNKSSFNNGCFMTEEPTIMMFNKPTSWTYQTWCNSDARYYLNQIPRYVVEWIYKNDMTDEEKENHPEYKTTGGYLKVLDETECAQMWWDNANEEVKQCIFDLPNFDAGIFKECTGIDVNKK